MHQISYLSKCRKKNWIEINDQSRGVYNTNSNIWFKTTMLNSSLYDYSDAYILVNPNWARFFLISQGWGVV